MAVGALSKAAKKGRRNPPAPGVYGQFLVRWSPMGGEAQEEWFSDEVEAKWFFEEKREPLTRWAELWDTKLAGPQTSKWKLVRKHIGSRRNKSAARGNPAITGDPGVYFAIGVLPAKQAGPRGGRTEMQSVLFHRDLFTEAQARAWLQDHDFKAPAAEVGPTYLRFRQEDPKKYVRIRVIEPGAKNPAGRSGTGRGNPDTTKQYAVLMDGKVKFTSDDRYRASQAATVLKRKHPGKKVYFAERKPETKRKRNPSAAALYEEFHGQPPDETLEFRDKIREHDQLAELGALVEMKIRTLTKLAATLRFDGDAPLLCSSPDGRQLYLQGGDQSLDLHSLKMDGEEWRKDSMTIGVIDELTYGTAKKFHHFRMQDYYHRLGEESGVQPFLIYDPVNKLLAVTGGQYRTGEPGIEN